MTSNIKTACSDEVQQKIETVFNQVSQSFSQDMKKISILSCKFEVFSVVFGLTSTNKDPHLQFSVQVSYQYGLFSVVPHQEMVDQIHRELLAAWNRISFQKLYERRNSETN